jgi:hypothetical protein
MFAPASLASRRCRQHLVPSTARTGDHGEMPAPDADFAHANDAVGQWNSRLASLMARGWAAPADALDGERFGLQLVRRQ